MFCPNINTQEWKDLVTAQGEAVAGYLWDKYKGEIPSNYFKEVSENESEVQSWFAKNLPQVPREVVDKLVDVNNNRVDAWGYFFNNIITVVNNAKSGTSYHEAFHAVFRNILSKEEASELISEALDKYGMPSVEELDDLKRVYDKEKDLSEITDQAFVILWLEEKMADDFADYTNTYVKRKQDSIWTKIKNLFNSILQFFNLATRKNVDKIEKVFEKINKGKFKNKGSFGSTKVMKDVNKLRNIPVYRRIKDIKGLPANQKLQRAKAIANKFKEAYLTKVRLNQPINSGDTAAIFDEIFKGYETRLSEEYNASLVPLMLPENKEIIIEEVKKILKDEGIDIYGKFIFQQIENKNIEYVEDETIHTIASQTTKGLGDYTSIPGMAHASGRMKLALSLIPSLDSEGKIKRDEVGDIIYKDMKAVYYYLEQNLIDLYTLDEKLKEIEYLTEYFPELKSVTDMLTSVEYHGSEENLKMFRNDFNTNFNKTNLQFDLVLYNGKQAKIINANRRDLYKELRSDWETNLLKSDKSTIAEFDKTKDVWVTRGTEKAISLGEKWASYQEDIDNIKLKDIMNIFSNLGIELEKSTVEAMWVSTPKVLYNAISDILKYHSTTDTSTTIEKGYRKSMDLLIKEEIKYQQNLFTSSFNDAENKNIYTIQMPTYVTKVVKKINKSSTTEATAYLQELIKDPVYKYNNLIQKIIAKPELAKDFLKLSFVDGLKKEHSKLGTKFMDQNNKDFYFMDMALYSNSTYNTQDGINTLVSKHVYLAPSDKKLQHIFSMPFYKVNLDEKGNLSKEASAYHKTLRNVVGSEIARIIDAVKAKMIFADDGYSIKDLVEGYHYTIKNGTPVFNGNAYKFHYIETLNDSILPKILEEIHNRPEITVEELIEKHGLDIDTITTNYLQNLLDNQITDLIDKGLIEQNEQGELKDLLLPQGFVEKTKLKGVKDINLRLSIANYTLSKFINNLDLSMLFNGDIAFYKSGDLVKRTYQSGSATSKGDTSGSLKISIVDDIEFDNNSKSLLRTLLEENLEKNTHISKKEKDKIIAQFDKTNAIADAWSGIMPDAWKRELEARGQWNDAYQLLYNIGEDLLVDEQGNKRKPTKQELEKINGLPVAMKPFGFGVQFNEKLGKNMPFQFKTAMFPLFNTVIKDNPLLQKRKQEADKNGIDIITSVSSIKAAKPFKYDITSDEELQVSYEFLREDFGIQVDNVQHMVDEENDAQRQLKMIMGGLIYPDHTYKLNKESISGEDLFEELASLESINITEDADNLDEQIRTKNTEFLIELADSLSRRNATDVTYKIFDTLGDTFKYPLFFGLFNTQAQNMLASVWTKKVIKQKFKGGSVVSMSSMGYQASTDDKVQKYIDSDPKLKGVQSSLSYKFDDNGNLLYVEAAMPAWSSEFFNEKGELKDIKNIPDEIKTFLAYRIPTEWGHSIVPVRVTQFIDSAAGNIMLLPTDITTILGEDFDFDKRYFSTKHFFTIKDENGKEKFMVPKYSNDMSESGIKRRYEIYKKLKNKRIENLLKKAEANGLASAFSKIVKLEASILSYEEFKELPIAQQNTKEARDNRILDIYQTVLTDPRSLKTQLSKSGFEEYVEIKEKVDKEEAELNVAKAKVNFFSAQNQNQTKVRNAQGADLKGQVANHVTAHAFFTKMGATLKTPIRFDSVKINDTWTSYNDLSRIENNNKEVIGAKVGRILAAVLDDLKNPVLETLNINNHTVDVICGLLRLGLSEIQAIEFLRHPIVKEVSKQINNNNSEINEGTEGYYTFKTAHIKNNLTRKAFYDALPFEPSKNLQYETENIETLIEKKFIPFLYTNDYLHTYVNENGNTGSIVFRGLKEQRLFYFKNKELIDKVNKGGKYITDVINELNSKGDMGLIEDIYKYLIDQEKTAIAYEKFKTISDALVKTNRYFALNKELGPDIETVLEKLNLHTEIFQDTKFPIKFERNHPVMEAVNYAAEKEMDYFREHFPYDTVTYENAKLKLVESQLSYTENIDDYNITKRSLLNKLNIDQRIALDRFLDLYLSYKTELFKDSLNPEEVSRILKEVPEKLLEFKKIANIEKYGDLREQTLFSQLKSDTNKNINFKTIKFKGNRADVSTKNAFTASMLSFFKNDEYRDFVIDLIKYSHITSGFQSGLDSFHQLIDPDILSDLGLDEEMRKIIYLVTSNKKISDTLDVDAEEDYYGSISESELDHVKDLLIRNNPDMFTKVISSKVVEKTKEGNDVIISIDSSSIDSKTENSLLIGQTVIEEVPVSVYAEYIRVRTVYDQGTVVELYKATGDRYAPVKTYKRISKLGKPGYLMEVYAEGLADKSYIGANNYDVNRLNNEEPDNEVEDMDGYNEDVFLGSLDKNTKPLPENNAPLPGTEALPFSKDDKLYGDIDTPPIEGEEDCKG